MVGVVTNVGLSCSLDHFPVQDLLVSILVGEYVEQIKKESSVQKLMSLLSFQLIFLDDLTQISVNVPYHLLKHWSFFNDNYFIGSEFGHRYHHLLLFSRTQQEMKKANVLDTSQIPDGISTHFTRFEQIFIIKKFIDIHR